MSQTKYGKYIVSYPHTSQPGEITDSLKVDNRATVSVGFLDEDIFMEFNFHCNFVRVSPPSNHRTLYKSAHIHNLGEVLLFLSISPDFKLGGDVEIYMGTEGEKHTFNSNTIVYIPKSFKHCPIYFDNFEKGKEFYIVTYYFKSKKNH